MIIKFLNITLQRFHFMNHCSLFWLENENALKTIE